MELLVWAKLAYFKFRGIPWNFSCQRNRRTSSSMEFHGTARVSEIGALVVAWNSMELLVSTKLVPSNFHGIPWNFSCQRNLRTSGSMEFHRFARVSEIGALIVPWNSMELLVLSKLSHLKFHGIPWNCSCHRNWRTPSSIEFHGTARVSEIGALKVPWNSTEFHGTARVSEIGELLVPWNSMELLHHRNWRTWSSMEFHGTARVIVIGALQVPWNSMELLVSVNLADSKFRGVPWNCSC